jgi:phage terminase large subunit-like protein
LPTSRARKPSAKAIAADPVKAYAAAVVDGHEPAGELLRAACARHLADLEAATSRGWRFDRDKAAQAIAFFGKLRHYKGEWAGQPILLEPFQRFIVGSLFGWLLDDGRRRYRQAYCEQPRGQGKSTTAAGIALRLLAFDGEPGAEVYCAATKKDQAKITWETARQIVLRVPALAQRIEPLKTHLWHGASASKLVPLGGDEDTLDGLRPNGVILDEIHAMKSSGIIDVLATGTGTRRQPLLFEITTAGVGTTGVCHDHHQYSSQVARGIVDDPSWFGCIIGADPADDWREPSTWRKANPNLGVSVKADDLARKALQAQHIPAFESEFRRLHLGQWVQAAERYLPMHQWDTADNAAPIDRASLRGQPCVIGMDVSAKFDFTAAVAVFRRPDGGVTVLPTIWAPEAAVQQSRRALVPLEAWVRAGHLHVTPGDVIDQAFIRASLLELAREFDVREVAYDSWNATSLATELQADGLQPVEVRQGYRTLSEPTKTLAALVATGRLQHGGHPVLRWMADNLIVRSDPNGNVAPDKARAAEKIDGIVALIMALSRLPALAVKPKGPRERGLIIL